MSTEEATHGGFGFRFDFARVGDETPNRVEVWTLDGSPIDPPALAQNTDGSCASESNAETKCPVCPTSP